MSIADPNLGRDKEREEARHRDVQAVRAILVKHLTALATELDSRVQTTHAVLGGACMDDVASALLDCWGAPGPYTISALAQHIRLLVEGGDARAN